MKRHFHIYTDAGRLQFTEPVETFLNKPVRIVATGEREALVDYDERPEFWRYVIPSEKGQGWAVIFIDSRGVFSAVSDFGNYGYVWNNHGRESIKHFLLESLHDWHYFAKKLDPQEITDWDATAKRIGDHIREQASEGSYSKVFAARELTLLKDSVMTDEWSFHSWYQETEIPDAGELVVRRLSFQVELFAKKVLPRLCEILKVELGEKDVK